MTTRAIQKLKDELATCRELGDHQREALGKEQTEHGRASRDAATYKRLYESQQACNKKISDRLRHQERLVRTLLDVLADQVCPIPAEINVRVDYRIAEGTTEQ